jgi:hypothetical protein
MRHGSTFRSNNPMVHYPLLHKVCDHCGHPFPSTSTRARFCSNSCRTSYWKAEYKLQRLVTALMDFYEIAERERFRLAAAVHQYAARFLHFAEWIGLKYFAKRMTWELVK